MLSSQVSGITLLNGGFESFNSGWQAMGPVSFNATNQRKRNGSY